MSAKLSTAVTRRVRDGRRALAAFEIEGPRVASEFLDTTEPHREAGDEAPHPSGFLAAVARKLRAALDHLVTTDFAVARAAARESRLRRQRKADKRQLAFLIVALRRLVLAYYLDPDLDNLGLQPVNVRDAVTVLRRAILVGERFAAVNLAQMLGEARFDGPPIDFSPYIDEIRTKAAELLALTDEINEAQRATDRARIERNRAQDDYDRVYLRGTRMFEDLCRFAGLDDLAATIRRRRPRSKASAEASGPRVPEDESRDEEPARPPRAEFTAPVERAGVGAVDLRGADLRAHEPHGRGRSSVSLGGSEACAALVPRSIRIPESTNITRASLGPRASCPLCGEAASGAVPQDGPGSKPTGWETSGYPSEGTTLRPGRDGRV